MTDAALTAALESANGASPWRFLHVVHRNYLVWRKLLGSALVGHLAEPLIWLVGLGFGLGRLLQSVDGLSYMEFLGSGMLCYSVMNSASFEGLWSAFTRLKIQRTWESILHAPMTVADIVIGEWVWIALKGALSGTAVLLVMAAFGLVKSIAALWVLPIVLLVGLAFGGVALIITALAKSYDSFTYYFSLILMPMVLMSGVFFPMQQLPQAVQAIAQLLPLAHATALARGLVVDAPLDNVALHVTVILLYAAASIVIASRLVYKRLMG
ncbi:MAG: ABC transporter permease [Steroidobacteraceae bacterium]|nr:ABC transporter permease [Steroidobacteraceae bacterium]